MVHSSLDRAFFVEIDGVVWVPEVFSRCATYGSCIGLLMSAGFFAEIVNHVLTEDLQVGVCFAS